MGDERGPEDDKTVVASAAGDETRFTGVAAAPSGVSSGPPDASIPPGSLLGHTYRIETVLARGGMGEIYRARHAELGTEHAIKIILPELANDQRIVDLFRREASVLRTIRHDAVVAYDGVFRDENGRLYLVMEFVDGPSLSKLMRERSFTADEIRQLRDRLADGLAVAHEKGVIHRDISPDNVILPAGEVTQAKIIDFGISKLANPEGKTIIGDDFAGKFSYVSPEQLGMFGGQVDGRSDIYSLGLVLAAAAQGEPLDMGLSPISVIEARRSVPDLSRVPEGVRADLTAMLQPDPADRPQSMRDLVRAAPRSDARSATSAARPPERRKTDSGSRARGSSGVLVAVGALAVLIVAGGLGSWYLWGGGASTGETGKSSAQGQPAQEAAAPATPTPPPTAVVPDPANMDATATTQVAPADEEAAAGSSSSAPAEALGASTASQAAQESGSETPMQPASQTVASAPPEASEDTTLVTPAAPTGEAVAGGAVSSSPPTAEISDVAAAEQPPAAAVDSAESSAQTETVDSAASAPAPLPVEPPAETQTAQLPRIPDIQKLRDDAQRAVQGLSCAGVAIDVSDAGDIAASGYVGTEADRAKAGAVLAALPDVGRVDNAVAVMSRPLCEALDVLRERTVFNLGHPKTPVIDPGGTDGVYREGDHLLIGVTAPSSYDGYLYVDYFDAAEGYVVHLLPNEMRRDNNARAGQQIVIGTLPQEVAKYTVSPPFGSNLLIAVASRTPLFEGLRPQVEQADKYLAALRSSLDDAAARQGSDDLTAGYRSVVFKP
ncbi:MAG: protein kinase [Dongiaceae bacterium]